MAHSASTFRDTGRVRAAAVLQTSELAQAGVSASRAKSRADQPETGSGTERGRDSREALEMKNRHYKTVSLSPGH